MTLASIILFVGVMLSLALIPSSSVALVVTRSATHGLGNGFAAAFGIAAADVVFAILALAGMTALAETLGGLFVALRIAAGLYLIWLGVCLIRARAKPAAGSANSTSSAAPTPARRRASLAASFGAGFALTLGDLKAIFFYASLFPSLFDLTQFTLADSALMLGITALVVGGVKCGYALAARRIAARFTRPMPRARQAAGAAMIGAGLYVIAKD